MSRKRSYSGSNTNVPETARSKIFCPDCFNSVCERILSAQTDYEKEQIFEGYIAENPGILSLDNLISKIDPAPENLLYSKFLELWTSSYLDGKLVNGGQALVILRNIKGFKMRNSVAIGIVENDNYEIEDLKNIIAVVADMPDEELLPSDNLEPELRSFEAKFRIAVAWITKKNPDNVGDFIENACVALSFEESDKKNLNDFFGLVMNCEDVVDGCKKEIINNFYLEDFGDMMLADSDSEEGAGVRPQSCDRVSSGDGKSRGGCIYYP